MSNETSLGTILRPADSLLDRPDSSQVPLTENQALVDQTVSSSVNEATKGSTLLAMLGAGTVSRLTRMGVMSLSLGEGSTFLPLLAKGGSYALALANESATFAGIERGFSHLEGHPSTGSFEKAWARSAISLGSLKFFGKMTEGQNLVLQHLATDFGMVGAQNLGHAFQIVDAPQGTLAQQMFQAEAMNWQMKGSLALLHGLSPNLYAVEKSLDLSLKGQEMDLTQKQLFPFFPQMVMAAEGGPETILTESERGTESKESNVFKMQSQVDGLVGGFDFEYEGLFDPVDFSERIVELMGIARKGNKFALKKLSAMLTHPDPSTRLLAASALDLIEVNGAGSAVKKVSESPEVRIQAVRALGKLGGRESDSILKQAFSDPDPRVRIQIVITLGERGGEAASSILKEALNDPDPMVRIQTILVMEKLNTPTLLVALVKALDDPRTDVRWSATAALGRLGYRATAPALEKVLNDPHPGVRCSAVLALGRLGGRASRPFLESALKDPDPRVRAVAMKALILLEGRVDEGGGETTTDWKSLAAM